MHTLQRVVFTLFILSLLNGCSEQAPPPATAEAPSPVTEADPLDAIAEQYVQLVLGVGLHDDAFVDAYYGPPEWREVVTAQNPGLDTLEAQAGNLAHALNAVESNDENAARLNYLNKQLHAVRTRIAMLGGTILTFDEETAALYDAVAPSYGADHFQAILDRIDRLLPGDAPLAERVETFRLQFTIPPDRLQAVFDAAIEECRRRTLQYIDLPDSENFVVEYVTDKPWSGYNWYQGGSFSLIQVNTDLPIFIQRAVDLGCHEGYPGHHTYNALLEQALVRDRGWVEFSVYPLFSPQSLIAEGSANFGIPMAFPGDQRVAYEKEVLFPLAGLDASQADTYYRLLDLLKDLSYAGNEAARGYLNGELDRRQAVDWLVSYNLNSPERADQRVDFFDAYRGYVINYNLGRDMVRTWVEHHAGETDADKRWQVFSELLASPRLPSDLAVP